MAQDINRDGLDDATGMPMPISTGTPTVPTAAAPSGAYVPGQTYVPPTSGVTSPFATARTYIPGVPNPIQGESVYAWGATPYGMNPHQVNEASAGRNQYGGEPPETPKTTATYQQIKESIYNMDGKSLAAIQKQLKTVVGLDGKATGQMTPETAAAFGAFLDYASELNSNGDKRTWDKILAQTAASIKKNGPTEAEGPFTGTRTATSTQSNVSLLSQTEAKRLAESAYTELLGGTPQPAELAAFRSAMDKVAKNNPTVTSGSTTTTYKDGIVTDSDSSSTSSGGYDATQVAIDDARSQEGYAEYQAASTYMDALMSAISAPVGE